MLSGTGKQTTPRPFWSKTKRHEDWHLSAPGHKATFWPSLAMSALPPRPDASCVKLTATAPALQFAVAHARCSADREQGGQCELPHSPDRFDYVKRHL